MTSEKLKDGPLREVAERITSERELRELGIHVLSIPDNKINLAITNHRHMIQDAAQEVLRIWLRRQVNRETAYTILYNSLERNKMGMLAGNLKEWVEG